jgi:4-diphosphocytidyl-2C-methyl-D-erythritol kinase
MAFWLTHPPQGCSTKEVYSRLRQIGSLSKTEEFLAACQTGQESKIGAAMFNALQLPACEINDWIENQLQLLKKCGCEHTLMSGSGSSCFGMVPRGGSIEFLRSQANRIGIRRVYQVAAWFGQSIERQLDLCETR